tara:strand:+ start:1034 stop:1312 length:279 start_codon:yes stop_codon:yes gene_type:complete
MNLEKATIILKILVIITFFFWCFVLLDVKASQPAPNAKFYDFSEQVIDGHIKKPTALYTDAKQKVKFSRLLELKKSFLPKILNSAKNPVFKQ